ncbi:transcription elongation factor GreA [Anaerolineae bacterium CFX9]|jgi:transcription elongation factor GreA|nr:transcription elongation factor GreA [Anaerolineae bacterium CFX9]
MSNQPNYLTPEGLQELEARLKYLKEDRRQQVAERLRLALDEGGDLSENAEYEDAKNEQAFIEGEILRLETILSSAQIIEQPRGKKDRVVLGSKVTLIEEGSKEKEIYYLVGSAEANPSDGKISMESPLGKAMLGAKVGDKVTIEAPGGEITFVIKAIA